MASFVTRARRRDDTSASGAPVRRPLSATSALLKFFLSGGIALIVLALASGLGLRQVGNKTAIDDARRLTTLVARGVIEPQLNDALLDGDANVIANLDRLVKAVVLTGDVVRTKVWSTGGTVLYSDNGRQIGRSFTIGDEAAEALRKRQAIADVTDLSRPENVDDRGFGKLLEVYAPMRTPDGTPVVLELYLKYSSIAATGRATWRAFIPLVLGSMLLLEILQVPLAWSLVRRVRESQRDREELLHRAVEASDLERRRIAHDLHDGIVQDLTGLSLGLSAAADRATWSPRGSVSPDGASSASNAGPEGASNPGSAGSEETVGTRRAADPVDPAVLLRNAADGTRAAIRQLRSLLVELYPQNLQSEGLASALDDLLAPLAARSIGTQLHVDDKVTAGSVAPATEALLYRTAQECIRNVLSHARATRVEVNVTTANGHVSLVVEDDGVGFEPETLMARPTGGHLGLRLIADLAREAGGELAIASGTGKGTRVELEVPR